MSTKTIWARTNGWHSFDITDAMVRWLEEDHVGVKHLKVNDDCVFMRYCVFMVDCVSIGDFVLEYKYFYLPA